MTFRKLEDLTPFAPFPSAHHFGVYMCPACASAHIVLFDQCDTPIAQMTLGPGQLHTLDDACIELFKEKGTWWER